jgi:hypothetical protein
MEGEKALKALTHPLFPIHKLAGFPTDGTIRTTTNRGCVHDPTGTYLHN